MKMNDTKITAEVRSVRELNLYLLAGWVLILSYVKHTHDTQEPRFVIGWQNEGEPVMPELLDEWELKEMEKYNYR
jgi:hypothetical protein